MFLKSKILTAKRMHARAKPLIVSLWETMLLSSNQKIESAMRSQKAHTALFKSKICLCPFYQKQKGSLVLRSKT
jgi:hypothetical protein